MVHILYFRGTLVRWKVNQSYRPTAAASLRVSAAPVKTPFSGEIVLANGDVESDATILNRSPYKKGWIVRIQPNDFEGDSSDLVNGEAAMSGFETYMAEKEISECVHCEGFEG